MSSPEPTGGREPTSKQFELKEITQFGAHNWSNETGSVPSYTDFVPQQNFRDPGGKWDHQVSLAWRKGFWDWFMLLLSQWFPSLRPQNLFNTPAESQNDLNQIKSLVNQGKTRANLEIQILIKKIFFSATHLEGEWANIQNQSPDQVLAYLKLLEGHCNALLQLKNQTSLLTKAESDIVDDFVELRSNVAEHYIGEPAKDYAAKLEALKQSPKPLEPFDFFIFYADLESEIQNLQTENTDLIPSLFDPQNTQILALKEMQDKVKDIISQRMIEASEDIKKRTLRVLDEFAKKESISLKQGTVQEKETELQAAIDKKITLAGFEVVKYSNTLAHLQTAQNSLINELANDERTITTELSQKKTQQLAKIRDDFQENLAIEKEIIPLKIVSLKEQIIKLEEEEKEIEAKKKKIDPFEGKAEDWFIVQVPLSTEDNTRLQIIKQDLIARKKELQEQQIKFDNLDNTLKESLDKTAKDLEISFKQQIKDMVEASDTAIRMKKNIAEQESATKSLREANANESKWKAMKDDLAKAMETLGNSPEMERACEQWMKLQFFRGAFEYNETKSIDKKNLYEWEREYYTAKKEDITQKFQELCISCGVKETSNAYRETLSKFPQILLSTTTPEAAQILGKTI